MTTTFELEFGKYTPEFPSVSPNFSVGIVTGFHYDRVGDRVSFCGKIQISWADPFAPETQRGTLTVTLPVAADNPDDCNMVVAAVFEGEGVVNTRVYATGASSGVEPTLFLELQSLGELETVLSISGSYLVNTDE
jgi:hypothetical protein